MDTDSHFKKVVHFNKSFGATVYDKPQINIFDDEKLVTNRLHLILEEVKELQEAIENKDFKEVIDALADIEYVVLGFYTILGVDADKAFDIVHSSNMSKLCSTLDIAKKTKQKYIAEKERTGYLNPEYRFNGSEFVVYNKDTGKILKSIDYTPADFTSLYLKEN